jgi:hypothetical protein
MHRTALIFGMLLSVGVSASPPHHKPNVNPTLARIHKIYVKGTNKAAADMRQNLGKDYKKYGMNSCFIAVGNEKLADAVLEVREQEHSGTSIELKDASGPAVTKIVAIGILTDGKGNRFWSDLAEDGRELFPLHGHTAAQNLLRSLYHDACGSQKGKRN